MAVPALDWSQIADDPHVRIVDLDSFNESSGARSAVRASAIRTELGEHPAWSPSLAAIVWVDIDGGQVLATTADGTTRVIHRESGPVGVALPRADGSIVVAGPARVALVDPATGTADAVAPGPRAGFRFNDGALAPDGALWVGDLPLDPALEDLPLCTVARHDLSTGAVEVLLTGMSCPNGIAWDGAQERVWVCESVTRTIAVADYDTASGRARPWRIALRFSGGGDAVPDGIHWTSRGLWVAFWGLGAALLIAEDGAILDVVLTADARTTSIAVTEDGVAWVTTAGGLCRADAVAT